MRLGLPRAHRLRGCVHPEGFTLLEATLVLLLLSFVVAGLAPLLTVGDRAYQEGWRRQEMLRNARRALDQMVRDIQGATDLLQASGNTLQLEVETQAGRQTVTYALQPGGDLTYQVGTGNPQPVAGPFGSFQLTCYDTQGNSLSCAPGDQVRQLELQLEALDPHPDPVSGPIAPLWVSVRVARRVP